MAICKNCGKELVPGAKFCFECGAKINDESTVTDINDANFQRKVVYEGEVHKCPHCGEILRGMTAICPTCGFEINSAKLAPALKDFIDRINELNSTISEIPNSEMPKRGWKNWKKSTRFWWIILNIFTSCIPLVIYLVWPLFRPLLKRNSFPNLLPPEQKKASLIESISFPNDRESILEALLFTKAQMEFIASEKVSPKNAYWFRLWNTKIEQLHQKACILLNNDPIAENAYDNAIKCKKHIDKMVHIRALIGALIIVIFVAFVMVNGSVYRGISYLIPRQQQTTSDYSETESNFEWLSSGLSNRIPKIEATGGYIWSNSDTELKLSLDGINYSSFDKYILSCQDLGYSIDAVKETNEYKAHDQDGYLLKLLLIGENLSINLKAPIVGEPDFLWPSNHMATRIPELKNKIGFIENDDEKKLKFVLCDISINELTEYFKSCEEFGFNIDIQKENKSFTGFNADGYKLQIHYSEMMDMTITIEAPMEFSKLSWPSSGPAELLPKPKSNIGNISIDYDWSFGVYLGEMDIDEYNAYIDKCIDNGFSKDHRSEHYFSASQGKDIDLRVEYMGFNTVYISISDRDKL